MCAEERDPEEEDQDAKRRDHAIVHAPITFDDYQIMAISLNWLRRIVLRRGPMVRTRTSWVRAHRSHSLLHRCHDHLEHRRVRRRRAAEANSPKARQ